LPWMAWHGLWVIVLAIVLIGEIALTLWDFIVEVSVRRSLGDVYPGERVTHALMGILYGAMLSYLLPIMLSWWHQPTHLLLRTRSTPNALNWILVIMGVGVVFSGIRDLFAGLGLPNAAWPWATRNANSPRI